MLCCGDLSEKNPKKSQHESDLDEQAVEVNRDICQVYYTWLHRLYTVTDCSHYASWTETKNYTYTRFNQNLM